MKSHIESRCSLVNSVSFVQQINDMTMRAQASSNEIRASIHRCKCEEDQRMQPQCRGTCLSGYKSALSVQRGSRCLAELTLVCWRGIFSFFNVGAWLEKVDWRVVQNAILTARLNDNSLLSPVP